MAVPPNITIAEISDPYGALDSVCLKGEVIMQLLADAEDRAGRFVHDDLSHEEVGQIGSALGSQLLGIRMLAELMRTELSNAHCALLQAGTPSIRMRVAA